MIDIYIERVDDVPVARPRGDIDAANVQEVRDELERQITLDADRIVIDLSCTRYVDSAGVDMLFRLHDRLRERRSELLLVLPADSQLNRLIEIVGLHRAAAVHRSVGEALGACAQQAGE